MASRENQTLQGILIVLLILVVGMGVGLIMLNNARNHHLASATSASADAEEARRNESQIQSQANNFKQWMGFSEADTFDTIESEFQRDMEQFGATFDETSRYYRTILENLHAENSRLAQSEVAAKERERQLKEQLLALEKEKDQQIAEYSANLQKVSTDRAGERSAFEQARREMDEQQNRLTNQLDEQRRSFDEMTTQHEADQRRMGSQVGELERTVGILRDNQVDPDPFAQPADGVIRWVNQRERLVWVNLGEADDLRPQVTFKVYSGDEADALRAESKGGIEITRILGPHMAEARITHDVSTRPFEEGDQIYSQVWNPGRQVGFAIAGVIDINNDGRSDLEKLMNVIRLSNGKVDAYPDGEGGVSGDMTVDTKYLIIGEFPEDAREEHANQRRSWEVLTRKADSLGVQTIGVKEFLQLMGWKPDSRTVRLGHDLTAQDFPARPHEGTQAPKTRTPATDKFRPRGRQPTY